MKISVRFQDILAKTEHRENALKLFYDFNTKYSSANGINNTTHFVKM